ncbi:MAG TPA: hypothetical protein VLA67_02360 [Nitrospiraceae bacterium]|nr:hypothetical protein [Nitrospiraceae bacterium]
MWSCPGRWMLVAATALSLMTGTTAQAGTSITQSAVVEADQATVDQILGAFHKADAAIAAEDQGGVWRIRGNAGETPRVLPFGTAPHPLF